MKKEWAMWVWEKWTLALSLSYDTIILVKLKTNIKIKFSVMDIIMGSCMFNVSENQEVTNLG